MRYLVIYLFITATCFTMGCKKGNRNPYEGLSQDELSKLAVEHYEEIIALASPVPCTDPDEWGITDIETSCGPGHIAYHQSTDYNKFRSLIHDYNLIMEVYKPMVLVLCAPYAPAIGVVCEEGKAIIQRAAN